MEDVKIKRRNEKFIQTFKNNDLIAEGEMRHLSLRKEKIEKYFLKKRNISYKEHPEYEVDVHDCGLSEEIINQTEELIINFSNPNLFEGLFSLDYNITKFSLYIIRRHYEKDNSLQVDITNNKFIIERLCQLLIVQDKVIQYESSWILINLTYKYPNSIHMILLKSNFNFLADFMETNDLVLLKNGFQIISNIVCESGMNRSLILNSYKLQIIDKLNNFLSSNKGGKSFVKVCLNLIYNLLHKKPYADGDFSKFECLIEPIRYVFMNNCSDDLDIDCIYIIGIFAISNEYRYVVSFLHANVTKKILELCYSERREIKVKTVKLLGNLLTGNDIITDLLINEGLLDVYRQLLEEKIEENLKEVLFGISNICIGTNKHLRMVNEAYLLDKVMEIVSIYTSKTKKNELQDDIIIECYYCICFSLSKHNTEVSINLVHNKHIDLLKLLINGIRLYCDINDRLLDMLLVSIDALKKLEDEHMMSNNFIHDCYKYGLPDVIDYLDENCNNKMLLKRIEILKENLDFYNIDDCIDNDNMQINN